MVRNCRILVLLSAKKRGLLEGAIASIMLFLSSALASAGTQAVESPGVRCFVSILPQEFFVRRIGGSHVTVNVLVGPGQEPHTFELTPKAVSSLAQADLFFTVGLPFEQVIVKKLARTAHKVRIIDTTTGIKFLPSREEHEHAHHHSPQQTTICENTGAPGNMDRLAKTGQSEGENGRNTSRMDPHIWLDPQLVKVQAANIAQALISQDPAHSKDYQADLIKFQQELDELDNELARALKPYGGQKFYVYHPAFGYFAARYGLIQVSVEVGGKEPTAKHIAELIKSANENGIRVIFVEPQFSTKSAEIIAKAIGGAVIPVDALSKDYLNNMRAIGSAIRGAMQQTGNTTER